MTHADKRICKCVICEKDWNISKLQEVGRFGYICPKCTGKRLRK